jgi:hypothetical protein
MEVLAEPFRAQRHAAGCGQTLPERAGRGIHSGGEQHVGMALEPGAALVKTRRAMSARNNSSIRWREDKTPRPAGRKPIAGRAYTYSHTVMLTVRLAPSATVTWIEARSPPLPDTHRLPPGAGVISPCDSGWLAACPTALTQCW